MKRFSVFSVLLLVLTLACGGCAEIKPTEFEIEFAGTLTDTLGNAVQPTKIWFFKRTPSPAFGAARGSVLIDSTISDQSGRFVKKIAVTSTNCDDFRPFPLYPIGYYLYIKDGNDPYRCRYADGKMTFTLLVARFR